MPNQSAIETYRQNRQAMWTLTRKIAALPPLESMLALDLRAAQTYLRIEGERLAGLLPKRTADKIDVAERNAAMPERAAIAKGQRWTRPHVERNARRSQPWRMQGAR